MCTGLKKVYRAKESLLLRRHFENITNPLQTVLKRVHYSIAGLHCMIIQEVTTIVNFFL